LLYLRYYIALDL